MAQSSVIDRRTEIAGGTFARLMCTHSLQGNANEMKYLRWIEYIATHLVSSPRPGLQSSLNVVHVSYLVLAWVNRSLDITLLGHCCTVDSLRA